MTARAGPLPEAAAHLCAGRQPELRQDDAVQPAHRLQPACGQFPGRYGGPQGRRHQGPPGSDRHRPAGHLLHVPLLQRGDRHARDSSSTSTHRHHQHCGCYQHRAQPVPDDAAHGAGHPHGAGAEHDGRGARQRRHHAQVNKLEEMLGIPVVPISAAKNEGIDELSNMPSCGALPGAAGPHRLLHGRQ